MFNNVAFMAEGSSFSLVGLQSRRYSGGSHYLIPVKDLSYLTYKEMKLKFYVDRKPTKNPE